MMMESSNFIISHLNRKKVLRKIEEKFFHKLKEELTFHKLVPFNKKVNEKVKKSIILLI